MLTAVKPAFSSYKQGKDPSCVAPGLESALMNAAELSASSVSGLELRSNEEVCQRHRDRALELDFKFGSGVARGIELDQRPG
jgi:hypothetical protein